MEGETARRRVQMIAAHFSTTDDISTTVTATPLFPTNCSSSLASIMRRRDNRMNFARQDSKSQACFMRQASTEQGCYSGNEGSETATPLFSQPASMNSNSPKIRNLQQAVGNCKSPTPNEPPKYGRPSLETDVLIPFSAKMINSTKKQPGYNNIRLQKSSPRMDVAESGANYLVAIELPGVSINDIKIEVDNTNLTVRTTKNVACSSSDSISAYHKRETLKGPFEILWPLPFNVNADSVSAEFLDGLLRITVPKLRVPVS